MMMRAIYAICLNVYWEYNFPSIWHTTKGSPFVDGCATGISIIIFIIRLPPITLNSWLMIIFFYIFTDSFVNSQEWTLSRAVPDLRLGIVGSLASGKSALVHRYLTGSYMQEESPEGGRFKKEISVDGQSYLLLIRDEGGSPELQVNSPR